MYEDLLVTDRIRPSSRGTKTLIEEVESDRSRVLYSASFRRLQRKTQVFPLEDNAAVRTRLTHSLEVAHVGRFLASNVIGIVTSRGLSSKFGLDFDRQHAFSVTVEVACLLHDIGNPPFGHFGEFAVSRWFSERFPENHRFDDLRGFDGNPQGFRIVSRLNGDDGLTGMNLTLSQLAATMKYQSVPNEKNRFKKFGAFYSEQDAMHHVREKFRLAPEQRFPLAYLMEAADDISYCLSDIEDGAEKRLVTHDQIVSMMLEESPNNAVTDLILKAKGDAERAPAVENMVSFRSSIIRALVLHAASKYVEEHDAILSGHPTELIDGETPEGQLLTLIKRIVRRQIYSDYSVQSLELAGMSVISGLLDQFGRLIDMPRDTFVELTKKGSRIKSYDVEKRLVDFIAGRHLKAYQAATQDCADDEELWHRAHLVVDYISGMTDPFALKLHQILNGIRI